MKFYSAVILFFFTQLFFCQGYSFPSARTIALNGSDIAISDSNSINKNIANTNFCKSTVLEFCHLQNYFVQSLAESSVHFQKTFSSNQIFQLSCSFSGDKQYKSQLYQLGYGIKLTSTFNAGLQINMERNNLLEIKYNDYSVIYPNLSFFLNATKKINLGAIITNPQRFKLNKSSNLPSQIEFSCGLIANPSTKFGFTIRQLNSSRALTTFALEYKVVSNCYLRAAYETQLNKVCCGFRITYSNLFFDFAFTNQLYTGNTSSFSAIIPLK